MRILLSLLATGLVLATLAGCSPPEAEFAWSEDTQNLLPEARKTVQTYVKDRFGTPAEMVAWQRLPVHFGGIPGRVKEVYRETFDDEELVTGFKIDFVTQAMIAKYDVNLDGQLSQAELPMALQEELSDSAFSKADQDQDGFLSGSEVVRLRTRSELLEKDDLDQVTPDNAEELVGKELLFVNGTFSGMEERTKITKINAEEGIVSI